MRQPYHHSRLFQLISHSIRFYFLALLLFVILCLLLSVFGYMSFAWGLLTTALILFGKAGFTILCGLAIAIVFESLS